MIVTESRVVFVLLLKRPKISFGLFERRMYYSSFCLLLCYGGSRLINSVDCLTSHSYEDVTIAVEGLQMVSLCLVLVNLEPGLLFL